MVHVCVSGLQADCTGGDLLLLVSVGGREGGSVVCGAPNPLKKGSNEK